MGGGAHDQRTLANLQMSSADMRFSASGRHDEIVERIQLARRRVTLRYFGWEPADAHSYARKG